MRKSPHRLDAITCVTVVGIVLLAGVTLGAGSEPIDPKVAHIFHHPSPHLLDGFGMAIVGSQQVVLVGTPNQVRSGREAGKTWLFERKTGQVIQALEMPKPTDGALFGQSVALTSEEVAIGAPHSRDSLGTHTGGVYVFDQATGKHRLTIANPQPITGVFGHALATKGKQVVVGDPQASTTAIYYTGAAYVFDVTSGEPLHTLRPPTPVPGKPSRFGHAVAFSESMIAVGAPLEHVGSIEAGVVYGFNRKTGALLTIFANPHPTATEFFGWSVAGGEQILLIGAFGYQETYREEGIAYVFDAESGTLLYTLKNPEPRDRAHFGKTVAILPSLLAVGAPGDRGEHTGISRGAVYLFRSSDGKISQKDCEPCKSDRGR